MELRLVLTVENFEQALAFYRDALGLEELPAWEDQEGRVAILDAGRATLELVDEGQAEAIDRIEVGRRVAGRCGSPSRSPTAPRRQRGSSPQAPNWSPAPSSRRGTTRMCGCRRPTAHS
jgi:catechol 2,3-dioxygenase-like lactoylglutathione lyase family enzyme